MSSSLFALCIVAILSFHSGSMAFSFLLPTRTPVGVVDMKKQSPSLLFTHRPPAPTSLFQSSSSNNDDEIAMLEEKLRKLKEEAQQQQQDDDEEEEIAFVADNDDEPFFEEMLSENWKASDPEQSGKEDGGGVIKNLIGAAILVVACIAFSQIPVGNEDYDKYSSAKPNTSIDLGDLNPVKTTTVY